MSSRRVEITLDQVTWDRLEAARLREPRASFVRRALESALGDGVSSMPRKGGLDTPSRPADVVAAGSALRSSASTRASKTTPKEVQALKNFAETISQHSPTVMTAREIAMERQRKLNEKKS